MLALVAAPAGCGSDDGTGGIEPPKEDARGGR
jgi:hypothetical protein